MTIWRALLLGVLTAGPPFSGAGGVPPEETEGGRRRLEVVEDYDVPPKPLEVTRPEYPPVAFEQGIEGTVILELVIDAKGGVARASVLRSIPELDDAALRCVKSWRFKPARRAGRPVAARAHAPIVFRRKEPTETRS